MEGRMKVVARLALVSAIAVLLVGALGRPAEARCLGVGGVGIGVTQGIASFMANAAMKNSAKGKLGDGAKIGRVAEKCEWKALNYECTARAQACR
jgi:hypothetical protein